MTGLADFDSLSAAHGLIGINRKRSRSAGFYGYRFRLTFAPGVDVATVVGAYWSLPYIHATEPKPPPTIRAQTAGDQDGNGEAAGGIGKRIVNKLVVGGLGGLGGSFLGASLLLASYQPMEGADGIGHAMTGVVGLWGGCIGGIAAGVKWVDPSANFLLALLSSVLLGVGVPVTTARISDIDGDVVILSAFGGAVLGATIASELWRSPLRRVSVGLLPGLKGGLAASATLHFRRLVNRAEHRSAGSHAVVWGT